MNLLLLQYAIRHNIRSHSTFKSDVVIKKIAGLVSPKHKVNLGSPDKVVLVEIFQVSEKGKKILLACLDLSAVSRGSCS
jgi:hypothetical protein